MSGCHSQNISTVLHMLETNASTGLTDDEAARRLARYGPNELIERGGKSPWFILWEQFASVMVVMLIIAAVVSAALGDYKDTSAILAIVILNAVLGFRQEYKAEMAMAALRKLGVPNVRVRRNGRVLEVPAGELTPGDIVVLEAGNMVPADGRLLESANLKILEASLTGESEPAGKDAGIVLEGEQPLADRSNMVFMGTLVSYGRGMAVVTETGMNTELGHIADMLQSIRREATPLQRRLDRMGRILAMAVLAIIAVIFTLGLLHGEDPRLMFLTAVSLAVAAVPEGLPAVVTITLAMGAQRMLKRKALIRKLTAVETLGSTTVVCSDKTGTLTLNQMTVTHLEVSGRQADPETLAVRDFSWRSPQGEKLAAAIGTPDFKLLLVGGTLCNDATLDEEESGKKFCRTLGDPTEGALVSVAARLGFEKKELEKVLPRIGEVPFESARKRMTTVHRCQAWDVNVQELLAMTCMNGAEYIVFSKGAVDSLMEVADAVLVNGRTEPLDDSRRDEIVKAQDKLARKGMRTLGVAFRTLRSLPDTMDEQTLERNLIFIGLVGMIDPPRPEAAAAVKTCREAGIRPVMITGDHPLTAGYIAENLGIAVDGRVVTGRELDALSMDRLSELVAETAVYARVSPEHKLKLVQALQNSGQIVAMTGDGVNDAPALKKADIGVAMGITGTDVAKEASDMILLDDNFATIVAAVEEGRVIYDNIRKFVRYIMTTNSGEIWLMLFAPFAGMPLPLLPLQILWMNLLTDGLPALGLSVEPAEKNAMRRPPRLPRESIFARGMGLHILWVGLLMALISLGMGYRYWSSGESGWQTMVFTTITLSQMAHVLAIRSGRESLFRSGLFTNMPLLGAVVLSFVLQLAVVYVPFLQDVFRTSALSAGDLLVSVGLSSIIFWAVELEKWLMRRRNP